SPFVVELHGDEIQERVGLKSRFLQNRLTQAYSFYKIRRKLCQWIAKSTTHVVNTKENLS
ncbi:hypothetical protein SJ550_25145, partial [Serratia marcescens]|uniref:hypothetical protein n=1 Tax=Serratia marcescens TaxID=615 RepID=UPI0029DE3B89